MAVMPQQIQRSETRHRSSGSTFRTRSLQSANRARFERIDVPGGQSALSKRQGAFFKPSDQWERSCVAECVITAECECGLKAASGPAPLPHPAAMLARRNFMCARLGKEMRVSRECVSAHEHSSCFSHVCASPCCPPASHSGANRGHAAVPRSAPHRPALCHCCHQHSCLSVRDLGA